MLAGCSNQHTLPRASQDEMPRDVREFDKTFDMVWRQMCIICPEKNAVIVALAHTGDEKRLLNAVWKHIYCRL